MRRWWPTACAPASTWNVWALPARLKQFGIGEDAIKRIDDEVRRMVETAVETCKAAPPPDPDILFTDVYADGGWAWRN